MIKYTAIKKKSKEKEKHQKNGVIHFEREREIEETFQTFLLN